MKNLANFVKLVFRVLFGVLRIEILEGELFFCRFTTRAVFSFFVLIRHVWQIPLAARAFQPYHAFTAPLLDHFHIELVFANGTVLVNRIRLRTWHRCLLPSCLRHWYLTTNVCLLLGVKFHPAELAGVPPIQPPVSLRLVQQLHILHVFFVSSKQGRFVWFAHDDSPQGLRDRIACLGEPQDAVLG